MNAEEISKALDSIAGDFGSCAPPIPPERIGTVLKSWDRLPALVSRLFLLERESPPVEQVTVAFFSGFYFGFLASQKVEEARWLKRAIGVE